MVTHCPAPIRARVRLRLANSIDDQQQSFYLFFSLSLTTQYTTNKTKQKQDKDVVVFHCGKSQQRGPFTAARFLSRLNAATGMFVCVYLFIHSSVCACMCVRLCLGRTIGRSAKNHVRIVQPPKIRPPFPLPPQLVAHSGGGVRRGRRECEEGTAGGVGSEGRVGGVGATLRGGGRDGGAGGRGAVIFD